MIVATIPVLFAVFGLILYVIPGSAERREIGRIMLFCGLLVALFATGNAGAIRIP
jgi:hypothetical protein